MIKAIPIVIFIIIAIVFVSSIILIPLYKYISKKIKKTEKEIIKINKEK